MKKEKKSILKTDDISLTSYLLTQGIELLDVVGDEHRHFTFVLADIDRCQRLKKQYLNNASASAQELFAKRELLISQIKKS